MSQDPQTTPLHHPKPTFAEPKTPPEQPLGHREQDLAAVRGTPPAGQAKPKSILKTPSGEEGVSEETKQTGEEKTS